MATTQLEDIHDVGLSDDLSHMTSTTQPEPLGLFYLPVELLDAIFVFLDRTSLCALALTCKATRTSASQALYATYVNRNAPSKAPFHLFLRTLCERPGLAAMVKELDIRGWRSEFEVATGVAWQGVTKSRENDKKHVKRTGPVFLSASGAKSTPPSSLKLFEETARKISLMPHDHTSPLVPLKKKVIDGEMLDEDDDFIRLLRHGVEDAQAVLMLSLLPNLTKIYIDGMSTYSTLDWHHFLRRSNTALRALRQFDLFGAIPQHNGAVHTTTLGFLGLTPDLEHLHLSHTNVVNPRQVLSLVSNKKLQCFSAQLTQVDRQNLRSLLSGHKIENFHYKPGIGKLTKTLKAKFAEDNIIDCLKDSKQSLQNLTLYSTEPSQTPVLWQFERLETLELPYQGGFFNGIDESDVQDIARTLRQRIPRSLSTLKLRYIQPSDEISVPMEVLADLKLRGELSELKTVRLTFARDVRTPWFPPGAVVFNDVIPMVEQTLGEMFKKAGLQLELAQSD